LIGSITNFWRVPNLVDGLASGERSVLDDLREVVNELIQHSASLRLQNGRHSKVKVGSIHDRLRQIIADLEQRKKKIKQSVRALTDTF
jgi:hypothetical protein